MTLEYRDSTDPIVIRSLITTITAPPGVGKTSLASTIPGCVALDFDQGVHRTAYRAPSFAVLTWADALAVHDHPKVLGASCVVVDTIGRAADLCGLTVVQEGAKGTVHQGALTLQGYGVVKARMLPWLARFRGKDLVLLSHQREEKKKDELIVRPDILGATLQEVLRSSDLIGYLSIVGGKRILDFDPTEDRLGKNSARLPVQTVPDLSKGNRTFLADLLAQAKGAMTTQTEESAKAESLVADWLAKIQELRSAEDFDRALTVIASDLVPEGPVKSQVKTLLNNAAKTQGLQYDKEAKVFKAKAA